MKATTNKLKIVKLCLYKIHFPRICHSFFPIISIHVMKNAALMLLNHMKIKMAAFK